jgi:D-apiose dehydrogenase
MLRFAMAGAGFWSHYQLAAWRELGDAECAALCDPDPQKAQQLATRFGIKAVFSDAGTMLEETRPDLFDIVAAIPAHVPLVKLAIDRRIPVICQKPMADTLHECEELVEAANAARLYFAVHENWRWQTPLRRVRELLLSGIIGHPFRARLDMISGFDVFANQPTFRTMKRFILADLGCHVLDLARSYFGKAQSIYCQTQQVRPGLAGEDAATMLLRMNGGQTVVNINLAYAGTPLERECFPQTLVFIEGSQGSLELYPNFRLKITTKMGIEEMLVEPQQYAWSDPKYAVVQSSMVPCLRNLVEALHAGTMPETAASDNLQTMRLVECAYQSATESRVIGI